MNVMAFIMYAKDNNAAEYDKWRTSESALHTLSLFGGWPGIKPLLTNDVMRHIVWDDKIFQE